MRTVPKDIADKLIKNIQTKGTDANPSTVAWISRPTTALTEDTFLEKQTVLDGTFTDVSIAVCHPYFGATNTKLNLAYISNGKANVMVSICRANMLSHEWYETGFSEDASAVALAYDGTMPKNVAGKYEFITELQPWVFWISAGVLYARKLGETETVILAEANCTDVTAIRAMWSDVPGFDFGLCVFFILSGVIYYRQFINGEWTDAELVPSAALPTGKTWVQISAQRTWDYRVALQLVDSTGGIFEAFTQFGGIGSKNAEHIEVKTIVAHGDITEVHYTTVKEDEHIEISSMESQGSLVYALSSIPLSVENLNNGSGNWGMLIQITFDYPIHSTEGSANTFVLTDGNNVNYTASNTQLSEDGLKLTITMMDFNLAAYAPNCVLKYTQGSIQCAATPLSNFSFSFNPINLVAPLIDPPSISLIWNE